MKKLLSVLVISGIMLLVSMAPVNGEASKKESTTVDKDRNSKGEMIHTTTKSESVRDIAIQYGVPLEALIKKNDLKSKTIAKGTTLVLPNTLSSQDKDLLARLVHAEAKGEPYAGKVAVADVVFNRIESEKFPDSVAKVVNAKGQFSPVANGSIKKEASKESKKAVNQAIALHEEGTVATFFYNPDKTNDKWIKSLKVIERIGNHNFSIS